MDFNKLLDSITSVLEMPITKSVIIFIIIFFLNRAICNYIIKYLKRGAVKSTVKIDELRMDTLFSVLKKICTGIIYFIGAVYIIQILFNINPASLIAATGVIGVAVGLASQSLVKDSINGFLILFENQYSIGELVTIEDFCGTVCEITLRVTRIKNYTGDLLIIPNSMVSKVINHSREERAVVISVDVDYSENIDRVLKTLNKMCEEMRSADESNVNGYEVWGVCALGSSGIEVKTKLTCPPGAQFALERAALKKVKETFEKEGISIPYNHIVVISDNFINRTALN